jgi:hypothetical protein
MIEGHWERVDLGQAGQGLASKPRWRWAHRGALGGERREQIEQTEARWQQKHVDSRGTLAVEARWQQKHIRGRVVRADRGTLLIEAR